MVLNLCRSQCFVVHSNVRNTSRKWIEVVVKTLADNQRAAADTIIRRQTGRDIVIIVIECAAPRTGRDISVLREAGDGSRSFSNTVHVEGKISAIINHRQIIPFIGDNLVVIRKLATGIIARVRPPGPIVAGRLIHQPTGRPFAVWIAD